MIHICFAIYDATGQYSKFTGTAMLSIFENHNTPPQSITVHILHDNTLTKNNREKLISVANRYEQIVNFYNVEELCGDKIKEIERLCSRVVRTRFSIGAYYRFFIPNILPSDIEKLIYMDSDVIVNLDIDELWRNDLEEKVLGVIPFYRQTLNPNEPVREGFNSGVLLLNIPALRAEEKTIYDEIASSGADDQTILNRCFQGKTLHLPVKFNRLVKICRVKKINQIEGMIYHFNGGNSITSFGLNMSDIYNRLWMSYFIRTPFFDANSIGRLYEEFLNVLTNLENYCLKTSAMMSGKTRAFFVEPKDAEAMKKNFSIRDDEEIILFEDEKSLDKLLVAMKKARGKKIFFILPKFFLKKAFPFAKLTNAGYVQGRDFLKAWELLPERCGEPFNSRPLIKAL